MALGLVLTGQLMIAPSAHAATTLTVGTVVDTDPATGSCSNADIIVAPPPLSLREATCLANNIGGEVSISVPAGTYALSYGELPAGVEPGQDLTYTGSGSASTIVDAQGLSRVFNLDRDILGGVDVTLTGLTVTGGADSEFGGAGIIGGSNYAALADSLTLDGVVISGNAANATDPNATNKPGGGLQFFGGTLTIRNSTISGNSSRSSAGAGIAYLSNGAAGPEGLTITGSVVSGNTMTNTSGGLANGGAVWIDGPAPATITGSRFVGNTVTASSGPAVGAAIRSERTALTVTGSTFTGNTVSGGTGTPTGGAIAVTSGSAEVHFNRFTGNAAASGSALGVQGVAAVDAADNWWGCNGGPGASGCDDTAGSPAVPSYLVLSATADPSAVVGAAATSTITGRFTTNSAGTAIAPADLDAFTALPVTFSDPAGPATVGGSAGAKTAPVTAGQAQVGFQANGSTGVSPVSVTFDNATVTTSVTVTQPPQITSSSSADFPVGTPASFTIQATGSPTPAITTASTLPAGITLTDNGNGTATLSGTAAPGSGGTYDLVLTAANGVNPAASQNFTLAVGQPPAFTSAATASFLAGASAGFTVTTSGVPAVTSIELTSGTLPAGLTFTGTGPTATISGTPAAGTGGTYAVVLTASNGGPTEAVQTVTVRVDETPAVTTDPADQTVNPGAPVSFVAAADGAPTPTVRWQRSTDSATFTDIAGATATTYTITATGADSGDAFRAVFTNTAGSATTTAATLTVGEQPTISSPNATTFTVGTAGTFIVTTDGFPDATLGVDPADALPAWLTFTDEGDGTGTLSGTPPVGAGGLYTFGLVAQNGFDPSDSQAVHRDGERAAHHQQRRRRHVRGGCRRVIHGDRLRWRAVGPDLHHDGRRPSPGLTLTDNGDGTASFAGTPTTGGVYPFTLTATNGVGPAPTQTFTATVTAVPVITSADLATFAVGSAGSFTVTTSAGTPPTTTLTRAGELPTGVTFADNGNGTGTLAGIPAEGAGGSYVLTLAATSSAGSSSQIFTLTVGELPAVTSADNATFTVGTPGTFAIETEAGYPTSTTLTVVVSDSGDPLPDWLILTDNTDGTATLTGTPPLGSGGSLVLTITATNTTGPAAQTFTLTLEEAPRISSAEATTFTAGTAGSFTVTTTAGTPPTTTLTLSGDRPTGVTFTDNGNGTGTLTGTPGSGTGGTYPLVITASNTAGSTEQTFTLTVREAPRITSAANATFALRVAGTFTVTTAAGFPTALTLRSTGALPAGLTLTDNGNGTATLSGTPTTGGISTVTVTAGNGVDPDATQALRVTVTAAPVITSTATTTFTAGTPGSFTVTTTAGTPPTTTLTLSGDRPTGVTFTDNGNGTGTLTGTPTAAGVYPLTLSASNGVTTDATQAFTLTVEEPPTITSADTATFIAGVASTFTVTAAAGLPADTTLSVSGDLPAGVTFVVEQPAAGSGATAFLSGSAASVGSYPLTLTATNGVRPDAVQDFVLVVADAVAVPLPADPPDLGGPLGGVPATVQGGQLLTISGDGCAAGAPVTVGTYPPSATLATTTADSAGAFGALVTVPAATGDLEIVASCIGVAGVDRFVGTTTTVTVVPPVPDTPVPGTVPTPYLPAADRPDRTLSYTGSPTGQIVTTALALLVMGGFLLTLTARRRRGAAGD